MEHPKHTMVVKYVFQMMATKVAIIQAATISFQGIAKESASTLVSRKQAPHFNIRPYMIKYLRLLTYICTCVPPPSCFCSTGRTASMPKTGTYSLLKNLQRKRFSYFLQWIRNIAL